MELLSHIHNCMLQLVCVLIADMSPHSSVDVVLIKPYKQAIPRNSLWLTMDQSHCLINSMFSTNTANI